MKKGIALAMALLLCLSLSGAFADGISMRRTPAVWNGTTIGQCFAPSDFNITTTLNACTAAQSLNNPLHMCIMATSPDERIALFYFSAKDYIHILETVSNGASVNTHVDGQIDPTSLTPMLQFMYASAYCDTMAVTTLSDTEMIVEAENTYPEAKPVLQQAAQTLYDNAKNEGAWAGIQVDGVVLDACERRYSLTLFDSPYYLCVASAVSAMQTKVELPGIYGSIGSTSVSWSVPYTYMFFCPQSEYSRYEPCYRQFMENTTASDQFIKSNTLLSNQLRESALAARSLNGMSSYSTDVLTETASSGDDYYEDRFTDYLFDNNEYTLSDGSTVKISTAYDYVYENSSGHVLYSNTAFSDGAGTRLMPKD